ncbi:hypothetical protein HDU85_000575 [Gaertneriomyces sp. JEL0708]|nr:hypothetical protein HDU85_000575 [Gaertneriomyces sp. JEL0708]
MEDKLTATIDRLRESEAVDGILVVDNEGLPLKATGIAPIAASPFIASIANRACRLARRHSPRTAEDTPSAGENDLPPVNVTVAVQYTNM